MQRSRQSTTVSGRYNPLTGDITATTAYATAHEFAHLDQHCRRTLAWRVRDRLFTVPVACRIAQLIVEIEAALLARETMRKCGIWCRKDATEAWSGILAYARSVTTL